MKPFTTTYLPTLATSLLASKNEQKQAIRAGYTAAASALDAVKKRTTAGIDWVALQRAD